MMDTPHMDNKIKFQFDDKFPHQINAIGSTVSLFDGLPKQLQGLYTGRKLLASDDWRCKVTPMD